MEIIPDLYYGLNIGWPIILARDPQAVYDLNIIALRLAEHKDVRLPVIVAYGMGSSLLTKNVV